MLLKKCFLVCPQWGNMTKHQQETINASATIFPSLARTLVVHCEISASCSYCRFVVALQSSSCYLMSECVCYARSDSIVTSLAQVVNRLDASWLSRLFVYKLDASCFNVTLMLNNILDQSEQCWQEDIVQSCFDLNIVTSCLLISRCKCIIVLRCIRY